MAARTDECTPQQVAWDTLRELAAGIDCGCMPCMGACWSREALREEIASRAELAQNVLRLLGPRPVSAVVCDAPDDVFTRATREMSRTF